MLDNNSIGPEAAVVIVAALRTNTVLEDFSIAENSIGNEGAAAFAHLFDEEGGGVHSNDMESPTSRATSTSFNSSSLKRLDLRSNSIGAAGAKSLSRMFHKEGPLRVLILRSNTIGAAGATALAKQIGRANCKLEVLSLARCGIGSLGGKTVGCNLVRTVYSTLALLALRTNKQ